MAGKWKLRTRAVNQFLPSDSQQKRPIEAAKAPYRLDPHRLIGASAYVPRFSIHVSQGNFSGADTESVFEDNEAAYKGAMAMTERVRLSWRLNRC